MSRNPITINAYDSSTPSSTASRQSSFMDETSRRFQASNIFDKLMLVIAGIALLSFEVYTLYLCLIAIIHDAESNPDSADNNDNNIEDENFLSTTDLTIIIVSINFWYALKIIKNFFFLRSELRWISFFIFLFFNGAVIDFSADHMNYHSFIWVLFWFHPIVQIAYVGIFMCFMCIPIACFKGGN
jgi:hypothetical protein